MLNEQRSCRTGGGPRPCRHWKWVCLAPLIVMATLTFHSTRGTAEEPLRWKFRQGERFTAEWTQRVETETTLGDRPLKLLVDTLLELDWVIDEVDSQGMARVTQSIRRVKARMDLPPSAPLEFDSQSQERPVGEARALSDALAPLVGPTWTFQFTPRGELLEIVPSPELKAALAKVSARGQIRKLFAPEATENGLLKPALLVLPEQPLKVGDSWTVTSSHDSSAGPIVVDSRYTLLDSQTRDDRLLRPIELRGTVRRGGNPDAARREAEPVDRADESRELEGTAWFDTERGRLVESQQVLNMRTQTRVRETVLDVRLTSRSTLKIRESAP